ncbi:phosphoribosylformylglycinamidine cyclo-ligase [Candidatus Peregrinibacteria bacterium]|nr:phosphoribosylformylglycinamidine cyclo-ligase [Candidatus Peregrinibacteria bacterium]
MATYKESGVDIEMGDKCSALAYQAAQNTFSGRTNLIGQAVTDAGNFTGAIDMGDYYLVQNDDGVGTKIQIAEKINEFKTLGYDLTAMVADDAVCVGAEPISLTNTLDVDKLDDSKIAPLMEGLSTACLEHKIIIPGGEIAELGNSVNGYLWNATLVGIVEKNKLITGKDIKEGDKIIGLKSSGFRSNGFSLVKHILNEKFGDGWAFEKYDPEMTWGQVTLTPSKIYSSAIMDMHGRYKEDAKVELKGVVHVTGGGIPGNINRVLKNSGLGANINSLPEPHEMIKKLMKIGNVDVEEAYSTWNMGVGMILISNDFDQIKEICKKNDIESLIIGEVKSGDINLNF